MTILINGESREIPPKLNIEKLLEHFSLPSRRVAIELNGNVARRADWTTTLLNEGDRLEVVHFVGGG
jgi:sulfur carrier protein